ncbi:MAG TPA: hypothetical protein HPP77_02240 [Candidatus Hydrogenedentes bacterium]|nr:hypothetical protein [Candidatus Hydrogenedentota bacterium]
MRKTFLIAVVALVGLLAADTTAFADFYYPDFSSISGLTLVGDAVQDGTTIRITSNKRNKSGACHYSTQESVTNGFETIFTYKFSSPGTYWGQGIAFVIQDNSAGYLEGGGNGLGYYLPSDPNDIAIEIDPYANVTIDDPLTGGHVSIQPTNNNTTAASLGYGEQNMENSSWHTIKIVYTAGSPGSMTVYYDDVPKISNASVDLSSRFPSGYAWVGFTGATGSGPRENQYIGAWLYDAVEGDTTPPEVSSVTRDDPNPTNASSVDYTVTFTEDVVGVDVTDFSLYTTGGITGASVTSVAGSGSTRTVTVNTGSGDGTIRLDVVDDDTIKDLADNPLGGPGAGNGDYNSGEVYDVDKTAPNVQSSTRDDPSPTSEQYVHYTVTFSESVTGVDTTDFSLYLTGDVTGASVTDVSGSGSTRTVTVNTGTGDGTLRLDVDDDDTIIDAATNPLGGPGAGNGDYTSGEVYVIDKTSDTTPPEVDSITRLDPNPTNAASVDFLVTFTEEVVGVDVTDFSLTTGGGISGASVTSVSGSGATRTVAVNTGSGDGTIRLDLLDDDTIEDLAGNPLGGEGVGNGDYTSGEVYDVDKTAPSVQSSTRDDPSPTSAQTVHYTVTFSESVTGVDVTDFSLYTTGGITGASVTDVSGSGSTRTVTVDTGSGDGTLRLDVDDDDTIVDAATNPLGGPGAGNGDYTSGEVYEINKSTPPPNNGIYNVRDWGAQGDGVTDDTSAFQNAMNQAASDGGGWVMVPAGKYKIATHLTIPSEVMLEGIMCTPSVPVPLDAGSTLLAVEGAGSPSGTPFITMNANSTLSGLNIYYPNQTKTNPPVSYPWTVRGNGQGCAIRNLTIVNPYQAVDFGTNACNLHSINGLTGQPLYKGLYVDNCTKPGTIQNVRFVPIWDTDTGGAVITYTRTNGTGFLFGKTDGEMGLELRVTNMNTSFEWDNYGNGTGNGHFENILADLTSIAFDVQEVDAKGLQICNAHAMTKAVVSSDNTGPVRFVCVSFVGNDNSANGFITSEIANVAGSGPVGFSMCSFDKWNRLNNGTPAVIANSYTFKCDQGGNFLTERDNEIKVRLNSGVRNAHVVQNRMQRGAHVQNYTTSGAQVDIGGNPGW